MFSDIKFGIRVLAKSRGFTVAAVLILALGIGLNTATFNAIYMLAFSPRAIPESDQLVQLYTQDEREPTRFRAFSHAAYEELRQRRDLFSGVLAQHLTLVAVGESVDARRMLAAVVSANYFEVLGVPPSRGRGFVENEGMPGADLPVVVVSHAYWSQTDFRADLVGSTVRINARAYTIIGVVPENFHGTQAMLGPDLYFPLGVFDSLGGGASREVSRSLARHDLFALFLAARLQPGVSSSAAASGLAGVSAGLEQFDPVNYQDKAIVLGPLHRGFPGAAPPNDGPIRLMGAMLLGLTGTVLLIVSLNLAGLLLVRGYARRKEFAIRLALGGTRARLVRQLLIEGLVLALAGGVLGWVCAVWVADLVIAGISSRLPVDILVTTRSSPAGMLATLVFCTLATLFFALGPAITIARRDLVSDLQKNAGEDLAGHRRRWMPRHPLVVAQIALSLALVIGAGLFVRMIRHAASERPGIDPDRTLVVEFDASLTGHDRARSLETFRAVGERLAAMPGVQAASIAASAPYSLSGDNKSVRRAGSRPAPDTRPTTPAEGLSFSVPYNAVGADYFGALGVPLVRGRSFTTFETDHAGAPPVAIVDETLAERLWPGGDALGQRIAWARGEASDDSGAVAVEAIEVVGIARATPLDLWESKSTGAVFVPFAQGFTASVYFFIRFDNAGEAALDRLREPVRSEIQAAAPEVAFFKVRTFSEHKDAWIELWAINRLSLIAGAFSVAAAFIAIIGFYGAKAYAVSRRTREIGIRLALGADPADVRWLIMREGLSSGLVGIGLGLLIGAALGRSMESMIVELDGFDPVVYGLAGLALFAAALAASWFPARQATRVNPLTALRTE